MKMQQSSPPASPRRANNHQGQQPHQQQAQQQDSQLRTALVPHLMLRHSNHHIQASRSLLESTSASSPPIPPSPSSAQQSSCFPRVRFEHNQLLGQASYSNASMATFAPFDGFSRVAQETPPSLPPFSSVHSTDRRLELVTIIDDVLDILKDDDFDADADMADAVM